MIKSLSFYHMHVDEYYTFGMQLIGVLKNYSAEEAQLSVLQTSLSSAIAKLDQAYLKPSSKSLTLSVKDADNKRDKLFKALRSYVEACALREKTEWGDAPERLLEAFHLYGWTLYSATYAKETSRLNQMFSDIDNNAVLTGALTKISALEWYQELKEAQLNFEQVYNNRNQTNAALPDIKTEDAVVELRQYFQILFKYVDSMAMMNIDSKYKSLSNELNELIAPFQAAINTRAHKDSLEENLINHP